MSTGTSIEWTDASWNPLRARRLDDGKTGWHCEHVSEGCRNCYAETFNHRRLPAGGTGLRYARDQRSKVETYVDDRVLTQPLRWREPRKVFVCSMTDLFGEWVSDEQIDRVFAVMAIAQRHTFQVLTKRPERMRDYILGLERDEDENDGERLWRWLRPYEKHWPDWSVWTVREGRGGLPFDPAPSNVWLGVSVEDQATADDRIPLLLDTPAAVRFVSYEPALEAVDFNCLDFDGEIGSALTVCPVYESGECEPRHFARDTRCTICEGQAVLDWIIVGGESGHGARVCDIAWIRSTVAQCKAAGVACFVKQLGARPYYVPSSTGGAEFIHGMDSINREISAVFLGAAFGCGAGALIKLSDRKGGEPSEWPEDLRVREFPRSTVPA